MAQAFLRVQLVHVLLQSLLPLSYSQTSLSLVARIWPACKANIAKRRQPFLFAVKQALHER